MELLSSKALIIKLKEAKEENHLTPTDIEKMVKQQGGSVALVTIKRVFAKGSENQGFSYDFTLIPLAKALLPNSVIDEIPCAEKLKGLNAIINIQRDDIERLRKKNEGLKNDILFLRDQIELKDKIIKHMMENSNVAKEK